MMKRPSIGTSTPKGGNVVYRGGGNVVAGKTASSLGRASRMGSFRPIPESSAASPQSSQPSQEQLAQSGSKRSSQELVVDKFGRSPSDGTLQKRESRQEPDRRQSISVRNDAQASPGAQRNGSVSARGVRSSEYDNSKANMDSQRPNSARGDARRSSVSQPRASLSNGGPRAPPASWGSAVPAQNNPVRKRCYPIAKKAPVMGERGHAIYVSPDPGLGKTMFKSFSQPSILPTGAWLDNESSGGTVPGSPVSSRANVPGSPISRQATPRHGQPHKHREGRQMAETMGPNSCWGWDHVFEEPSVTDAAGQVSNKVHYNKLPLCVVTEESRLNTPPNSSARVRNNNPFTTQTATGRRIDTSRSKQSFPGSMMKHDEVGSKEGEDEMLFSDEGIPLRRRVRKDPKDFCEGEGFAGRGHHCMHGGLDAKAVMQFNEDGTAITRTVKKMVDLGHNREHWQAPFASVYHAINVEEDMLQPGHWIRAPGQFKSGEPSRDSVITSERMFAGQLRYDIRAHKETQSRSCPPPLTDRNPITWERDFATRPRAELQKGSAPPAGVPSQTASFVTRRFMGMEEKCPMASELLYGSSGFHDVIKQKAVDESPRIRAERRENDEYFTHLCAATQNIHEGSCKSMLSYRPHHHSGVNAAMALHWGS
eukprot:gnl/TRDRNA2_/TRDRNA2_136667_c0_seq1.p1 gnl/TRDRNA2_/TRDRNA2_136667_c0~~gnl/TRDRNA2_/TRDRNA2_136667_c0_seq1.p1  ORF type:complete len:651 (+),score=49.62 gnl/TRDRNA2_/TRDRNA2_136667_c0_seq1:78-2030(+)